MTRPLIGITCGTSALDTNAPIPQDRLNQSYSRAIWQAGATPVILPNLDGEEEAQAFLERMDGLLLSGGYDLHPSLYHEEVLNASVEVDAPRDKAELPLIHAALARQMPLFAICRGIQALNVALGGTLYQDIPTQKEDALPHRQAEPRPITTHTIYVEPDSLLARILGDTRMEVNSFHHQAIRDVGQGLVVTARAEDGVIEAIEDPRAPFLLGVQFHPEEMVETSDKARRLFRAFVEAAARSTRYSAATGRMR